MTLELLARGSVGVRVAAAVALIVLAAISALTLLAQNPHQQPDDQQFCFAEWCIAPAGIVASASTTVVHVNVRSESLSVTQRPDHPQAWLNDGHGHVAGGPQTALDRAIGPGEQYRTDLTFTVATTHCATFTVGEGAWPPFLGLGYAPSPFTERAAWRLCI